MMKKTTSNQRLHTFFWGVGLVVVLLLGGLGLVQLKSSLQARAAVALCEPVVLQGGDVVTAGLYPSISVCEAAKLGTNPLYSCRAICPHLDGCACPATCVNPVATDKDRDCGGDRNTPTCTRSEAFPFNPGANARACLNSSGETRYECLANYSFLPGTGRCISNSTPTCDSTQCAETQQGAVGGRVCIDSDTFATTSYCCAAGQFLVNGRCQGTADVPCYNRTSCRREILPAGSTCTGNYSVSVPTNCECLDGANQECYPRATDLSSCTAICPTGRVCNCPTGCSRSTPISSTDTTRTCASSTLFSACRTAGVVPAGTNNSGPCSRTNGTVGYECVVGRVYENGVCRDPLAGLTLCGYANAGLSGDANARACNNNGTPSFECRPGYKAQGTYGTVSCIPDNSNLPPCARTENFPQNLGGSSRQCRNTLGETRFECVSGFSFLPGTGTCISNSTPSCETTACTTNTGVTGTTACVYDFSDIRYCCGPGRIMRNGQCQGVEGITCYNRSTCQREALPAGSTCTGNYSATVPGDCQCYDGAQQQCYPRTITLGSCTESCPAGRTCSCPANCARATWISAVDTTRTCSTSTLYSACRSSGTVPAGSNGSGPCSRTDGTVGYECNAGLTWNGSTCQAPLPCTGNNMGCVAGGLCRGEGGTTVSQRSCSANTVCCQFPATVTPPPTPTPTPTLGSCRHPQLSGVMIPHGRTEYGLCGVDCPQPNMKKAFICQNGLIVASSCVTSSACFAGTPGPTDTCQNTDSRWQTNTVGVGGQCCGGGTYECQSGNCSGSVNKLGVCLAPNTTPLPTPVVTPTLLPTATPGQTGQPQPTALPTPTPRPTCHYAYSGWSECRAGLQNRQITSVQPANCTGSPEPLVRACGDGVTCQGDSDCASYNFCYQPPMPPCPEGLSCAQVMPPKECQLRKAVADINDDGQVNIIDLSQLLKNLLTADAKSDLNQDDIVDIVDYSLLIRRLSEKPAIDALNN